MRATLSPSALLASALLGAGCSLVYGDELDKRQCNVDADCEAAATRLEAPLVCREHACQPPTCDESSPCPSGSMCTGGLCIADPAGSPDAGSDAAPAPVTCTQDTDCKGEQHELCGLDGYCYAKWGCLEDDLHWPSAPANIDFQIQLQDTNPPTPNLVETVAVSACTAADPTCSRPIVVPQNVTISADKLITVPFAGLATNGFVGAIRFESSVSGVLPSYLHFTAENPLVGPFKAPRPVQLIAQRRLQNLALFTGITASADAAGLFAYIFDCGGRPAASVSLAASNAPNAKIIPLQGESGPLVGSTKTTPDGTMIVVNLPPNLVQVFTLRDEEASRVITDTLTFIPRGPGVNLVMYYPRQSSVKQWLAQAQRGGGPQ